LEQIAWTDEFSMGVAAMDAQHKTIIAMVNQLSRMPGATTQSAAIADLLTEMRDYTLMHLEAEEYLMAAHHYPQMKEQCALHRAFREKIIRFSIEWAYRDQTLPNDLLTYLRAWWVHHILAVDNQYSALFHERGVS
jgi:hemerythrin-like metal-binding protein